jgi:beta-lactamase class C
MLAPILLVQALAASDPGSAGMSPEGLRTASAILDKSVRAGEINSASILVTRRGKVVLHRGFGRAAEQPDSVYLLASITKPVTACALMLLVERGSVSLNDPVSQYLPDFRGAEKDKVVVRDLLAHTSGLPDMLPENIALRRANAPLSAFVEGTYKTPLLYSPGKGFAYQSMGILLAAEIVEKITGMRLRDFLKREIFNPLGMKQSALGLGHLRIENTVPAWVSPDTNPEDTKRFGPNSAYWRDMGHPWGGMHSTVSDLTLLLTAMLNGTRIFSPATIREMITDQNTAVGAPWGLGWALGRSKAWNFFGDLVSPSAFGHAGATGTVAWADPASGVTCVILTDRLIHNGSLLRRVSNAVAASVRN